MAEEDYFRRYLNDVEEVSTAPTDTVVETTVSETDETTYLRRYLNDPS